ncbi:GntR family transcriptional regulator [Marseilla massiliensis]|uniref:GntR family transcriptional regulator n=2 Tax=Marseilla massiliensis TaxID=1841864 RepID=A0A939B5W2_9BACT|nr:GntR family transcriptional regulator [Marseilla massiliensis]
MTTFNPDKPIYLQMAERLCDEILAGTYSDDDRVPSVREYAVMLEVNTNTAVKAYDALARDNVIYNRRGLGYFVFSIFASIRHKQKQQRISAGPAPRG